MPRAHRRRSRGTSRSPLALSALASPPGALAATATAQAAAHRRASHVHGPRQRPRAWEQPHHDARGSRPQRRHDPAPAPPPATATATPAGAAGRAPHDDHSSHRRARRARRPPATSRSGRPRPPSPPAPPRHTRPAHNTPRPPNSPPERSSPRALAVLLILLPRSGAPPAGPPTNPAGASRCATPSPRPAGDCPPRGMNSRTGRKSVARAPWATPQTPTIKAVSPVFPSGLGGTMLGPSKQSRVGVPARRRRGEEKERDRR